MTSRNSLRSNRRAPSLRAGYHVQNMDGMFRMRINFQILSGKSSTQLGSDYGTKPRRSFHEETVYPHCPGNRAHPERIPQRVCQRVHQHASPRLVRNPDRKPILLRRRSRRAWWTGRLRSGICRRASHCLNSNVDRFRILLRRRSRRAWWTGRLRSGICRRASHCLNSNVDQFRILLRRRSGRAWWTGRLRSGIRQHTSQCRNGSIDQTRLELNQVGRLSVRRDGQ